MNFDKYILVTLLVLIGVYFSQGALYAQGSLLSQIALVSFLSMSLFFAFRTLFSGKKKPLFFKIWTALLILNLVGFVFTGDPTNTLHFGKFKGILIIALPFYPIYYFAERGILKASHLAMFCLGIFPIIILHYYLQQASILSTRSWSSENVVNNVAYDFVFLIPYLFMFRRNRIVSIGCAVILVFFLIQGAKRGALIAGTVGILLFMYYQFKAIEKKSKIKGYAMALIAISCMVYYGYNYYISNEYLVSRMSSLSEGSFSGRDVIYANIFNSWYHSNSLFNIVFGFGFASSLTLSGTGNWAHNDWLEGLAGFGLVGVVLYALLFFSVVKILIESKWNIDKKIVLFTIVVIWLFTTLVSMNYYNATNSVFQYIVLAFLIGSKRLDVH